MRASALQRKRWRKLYVHRVAGGKLINMSVHPTKLLLMVDDHLALSFVGIPRGKK